MKHFSILIVVVTVVTVTAGTGVAQANVNIELVGRIGTSWEYSNDVVVDGDYAYLATCYCGLQVLDISDPDHIENVGSFDTHSAEIRAVFRRDDFLFMALEKYGLLILDISDPTNPQVTGSCELEQPTEYGSDVFVTGNYAYLTEQDAENEASFLSVIDISNPGEPDKICAFETGMHARGVFVLANYAYVACGSEGLRIIDISDPENPNEVGICDTPGSAFGVFIMGEYACVADYWQGLQIIDVSDQANPQGVGVCNTPGDAMDVFVDEEYAYIADNHSGLCLVDLSDPAEPRHVATCNDNQFGAAGGVFVSGDAACVAANGLRVVDVSDPESPNETGYYCITGYSKGIFVADEFAYVANGTEGLLILDISDPEIPQKTGELNLEERADDLFVQDGLAYVLCEDVLRIVDVGDPEDPTELGAYEFEQWSLHDIHVSGSFAYVADSQYGLKVLDVSDPANIREEGICEIEGSVEHVFVSGEYAYVTNRMERWFYRDDDDVDYMVSLAVIDITDPAHPRIEGTCQVGIHYYAAHLSVMGGHAFVSTDSYFFSIDVSDPENPEMVNRYENSGGEGITVSGDYAFVSNWSYLDAIDISEPDDPGVVGYYNTLGSAMGIFATDEFIYVADGYNVGIYRLEITGPVVHASSDWLDYNVITVDQEEEFTVNIRNLGVEELTISGIDMEGDCFSIEFEDDFIIQPGDNQEVHAAFTPEEDIEYGGQITITSDSPIFDEFTIWLDGFGLKGRHFDLPEGNAAEIFVLGDYAYVGSYNDRFHVIEISDPDNFREVGTLDSLAYIKDVFVADEFAYLVDNHLHIIDVSNPENPVQMCDYDTPGHAHGVSVSGDYAYVADYEFDLSVINISNPENPFVVDTCEIPGYIYCIFIQDNCAYVTTNQGCMRVIDISNPENIEEVGVWEAQRDILEVYVADQYAYIASGLSDLLVIDISNPENPFEVGAYEFPNERVAHVFVSDNYAYIANDYRSIHVLDISDPAMPAVVETYHTPWRPVGIFVSDEFAYVADGGIEIFHYQMEGPFLSTSEHTMDFGVVSIYKNLEKTLTIRNLGIEDLTITGISAPDGEFSVGFDGEIMLEPLAREDVSVTFETHEDGPFEGVLVLESNDPHDPAREVVLTGGGIRGYRIDTPGSAHGVFVSENYAYIADRYEGLRVIDISIPESLEETGFYDSPGVSGNVFVEGDFAYLADGARGLSIVDISNPESPEEVGLYDMTNRTYGANDVFKSGDHAFIVSSSSDNRWQCWLLVIDVTDPANPVRTEYAARIPAESHLYSVFVSENLCWVTSYQNGIFAVDVSNPDFPVVVSNVATPGSARDIFVSGDYAYVADGGSGLTIFNVSDPRECELLVTFDTPGYAYDVVVEDGVAYVADGAHVFSVVDVSDPYYPVLTDSYWVPDDANSVCVSGNYAYVANDQSGLSMLGLSDEWGVDTEPEVALPEDFYLSPAYPNPFNSTTNITYGLPVASYIVLELFDLTGRRVSTLVKDNLQPGIHQFNLRADDLPSGLYFVRLEASEQVLSRKILLLK